MNANCSTTIMTTTYKLETALHSIKGKGASFLLRLFIEIIVVVVLTLLYTFVIQNPLLAEPAKYGVS